MPSGACGPEALHPPEMGEQNRSLQREVNAYPSARLSIENLAPEGEHGGAQLVSQIATLPVCLQTGGGQQDLQRNRAGPSGLGERDVGDEVHRATVGDATGEVPLGRWSTDLRHSAPGSSPADSAIASLAGVRSKGAAVVCPAYLGEARRSPQLVLLW